MDSRMCISQLVENLRKRKGRLSRYAAVFMIMAAIACNEEQDPGHETDTGGAVRPFGDVTGNVEELQVGPAGGIITIASGAIEINVPEGALSSTTTIGIQPVVNTAPNGSGQAYRLTPGDIVFKKPVSITMIYSDSVSFIDGVGIAFQADNGIWYWPGVLAHDRESKRVTVETTHFSDWAIIETSKLVPADPVIFPGEEVTLQVMGVFPADEEDYLLTPLVPVEPVPVGEPKPVHAGFIKDWQLEGEGTLHPDGNAATYVAPGTIPDKNPVTVFVRVSLPSGNSWPLMTKITIGGSEIMLDGGPYSAFRAVTPDLGVAGYDKANDLTVVYVRITVDGTRNVGVSISFPGKGTGKHLWKQTDCYVETADSKTGAGDVIAGSIDKEDSHDPHMGYIQITRYGEVGGMVHGTFGGNLTFIDSRCNGCKTVGSVRGTFTARRHY